MKVIPDTRCAHSICYRTFLLCKTVGWIKQKLLEITLLYNMNEHQNKINIISNNIKI